MSCSNFNVDPLITRHSSTRGSYTPPPTEFQTDPIAQQPSMRYNINPMIDASNTFLQEWWLSWPFCGSRAFCV